MMVCSVKIEKGIAKVNSPPDLNADWGEGRRSHMFDTYEDID